MGASNFPSRPFRLEQSLYLISQNVSGNTSYVGADLFIRKNSYSPTWSNNASSFTFWIAGGQVAGWNFTYDFRNSDALHLAHVETTVYHNADGTRSFMLDSYANVSLMGYTEVHDPIYLPTIPRASYASFNGPDMHSLVFGQPVLIATNRASTSFTHDIDYYFGNASGRALTGVADSGTWNVPLSLMTEIPDATTYVGRVRTHTYNGGTFIGWTESLMRINVPATIIPTWTTAPTIVENTAGLAAIIGTGKYLQGVSTLKGTITGAAGVYGSTITSQTHSAGSETVSGAVGTFTQPISVSGSAVPVTQTITDSRGRTKSQVTNIEVLPYSRPIISNLTAERANASNAPDPSGSRLKLNIFGVVQSIINSTQRNRLTLKVYTKLRSSSTWSAATNIVVDSTTLTYNTAAYLVGPYLPSNAYDIKVELVDKFNTTTAQTTIGTGEIFQHWAAGLGVGKYWENGMIDVYGDVYLKQNSGAGQPGALIPAATSHAVVSDRLPHVGTTAQRDDYYGSLATSPQQVALANRCVVWYNTDKGYYESFYVVTGSSGLTAKGLVAGHTPGWYPLPGTNLVCTRIKSNDFQPAAAGTLITPTLLNPPLVNLGGFTVSGNNVITPPFGGYYDVVAGAYWSGGGAMAYRNVMVNYTSGTYTDITSVRFPGTGNDGQGVCSAPSVLFAPGIGAALTLMNAGADNIYGDGQTRRTFLTLKYAGPPVVNG